MLEFGSIIEKYQFEQNERSQGGEVRQFAILNRTDGQGASRRRGGPSKEF